MTEEDFDRAEALFSLSLDASLRDRIRLYTELLLLWNRKINLTSLVDPWDVLRLHFMEAFWAVDHFAEDLRSPLGDIGSGAGFPGVAIKLYRPDLTLVVIEKNRKKTVFLKEVARELGLDFEIVDRPGEAFDRWHSLRMATIRALRPSTEIRSALKENRIPLMAFHGKELDFGDLAERRAAIPHSRNRFVSLVRFT